MLTSRSLGFVGLLAAVGVGCLDVPQLSLEGSSSDGGNGARSSVTSARDGMVLIPAVTLEVAGGVAPAGIPPGQGGGANEGGSGKSNGKDAGAKDAGVAPPTPPATPSTTHVEVPAFWLDVREVTASSYRACIDARACSSVQVGPGCALGEGLLDHPITCVTTDQARAFCTWSSKRLVTSDEWTAAAQGTTQRTYPWGADQPAANRLNACGSECDAAGMYGASDGYARSAPGGSFPSGRTAEGVDDLAGNVAEWVAGVLVPTARGGSYEDVDPASVLSTAFRISDVAPAIGFRCASD